MTPESVTVEREALYTKVWAEPMSRLGPRYGISDVALGKICRKMDIPRPGPGHWARLAAGHEIPVPPLPPLRPGVAATVTLTPQPPRSGPGPEAEARIAVEKESASQIQVPERLTRPHPLVRKTHDALGAAKPNEHGLRSIASVDALDVRVAKPTMPRALRILDALLKAVEARGFRVKVEAGDSRGTYVELLGERVQIGLEEELKRLDHVPTRAEQEEMQRFSWRKPPRWDYEPSGLLKLSIKELTGIPTRKNWSDGRRGQLESHLNEFIAGLAVVAETKRRDREERERQQLEWRAAEERRIEMERRRRAEEARRQALDQEAATWAQAQAVRAYADSVERAAVAQRLSVQSDGPVGQWLEWARRQADSRDPVSAVLTAILAAVSPKVIAGS